MITPEQARLTRLEEAVRSLAVWAWGDARAPEFRPIVPEPPPVPAFSDPRRDWSVEILTLAADLLDEHGQVRFGKDEAKAIRNVLGRLSKGET